MGENFSVWGGTRLSRERGRGGCPWSPGACNKMTETCPSTRWADAGGGSCTDTPRGEPVGAAWGPHRECGFDAGGLPARLRTTTLRGGFCARPRAGALRSAGTHAAQRRCCREARRRGVGWSTLGYHSGRNARECGGTSLVPAIFTKIHENESLPLCPLLGGGAAKGEKGKPRGFGGGRGSLPLEKRGNLAGGLCDTRDEDIPTGPQRGNRSEPWNYDPRNTLTPD
jgi:hypothetical protein